MINDVIVVGAGPAGAVLAYQLASRGLQVLVLERAALPRYKACGGGLPLKAVRGLPFDASSAFELPAQGGIICYRGRQLLKVPLEPPLAWLVMRDRFDHFLIQRAVEAGARLLERTLVTGVEETGGAVVAHTPNGDFTGRLLAGADGVNSRVARSLGLLAHRTTGLAIDAEIAVDATALQTQAGYATFDFGALPHGYGWIFPKQDHLSVGVFLATSVGVGSHEAVELRQHLERFVSSYPQLRGREMLTVRGHRIPLGGGQESLHKGRALLVGDAANLADAWLGEGIYYGVTSASIAADVMVEALSRDEPDLGRYSARIVGGMGRQFGYARRLAGLAYHAPRLCTIVLSRSPEMQNAVFGTMRGDYTMQELQSRLVRQAPRILAQALRGQA